MGIMKSDAGFNAKSGVGQPRASLDIKSCFFSFWIVTFFEGRFFLEIWGVPPRVEIEGFRDGGVGSISELIIYRAIY